jgi:hypothetical protein
MALTNGPQNASDASAATGDHGITHTSYVHYTKDTSPFVAHVERVHYGGRPAADLDPYQHYSKWRRERTEYMTWNGSTQWDAQTTVGNSNYSECGSVGNLCWWDLTTTADLEGSAMVGQRLAYKITFWAGGLDQDTVVATTKWYGSMNEHYLE